MGTSMDVAITICFKMRDWQLLSTYNGGVVCDFVGNEYVLYI